MSVKNNYLSTKEENSMDIKRAFINCMIVLCIGVIILSAVTVMKRRNAPKNENVITQEDFAQNQDNVFVIEDTESTEDTENTETQESSEDEVESLETKTMYTNARVNVRTGPGTEYTRLIQLYLGAQVTTIGELDENGWQRIDYQGQEAYVLGQYLSDEKPVVPPAPTPEATPNVPEATPTNPPTPEQTPVVPGA